MTNQEKIDYWVKSSEVDFRAMQNLFNSDDYAWALFVGHLVIEKLLKGLYQKVNEETPPYTHDLLRLANYSNLDLKEEQKSLFDEITTFNIATRYSEEKFEFYKKANKDYASFYMDKIKELRKWLTELLTKQ